MTEDNVQGGHTESGERLAVDVRRSELRDELGRVEPSVLRDDGGELAQGTRERLNRHRLLAGRLLRKLVHGDGHLGLARTATAHDAWLSRDDGQDAERVVERSGGVARERQSRGRMVRVVRRRGGVCERCPW